MAVSGDVKAGLTVAEAPHFTMFQIPLMTSTTSGTRDAARSKTAAYQASHPAPMKTRLAPSAVRPATASDTPMPKTRTGRDAPPFTVGLSNLILSHVHDAITPIPVAANGATRTKRKRNSAPGVKVAGAVSRARGPRHPSEARLHRRPACPRSPQVRRIASGYESFARNRAQGQDPRRRQASRPRGPHGLDRRDRPGGDRNPSIGVVLPRRRRARDGGSDRRFPTLPREPTPGSISTVGADARVVEEVRRPVEDAVHSIQLEHRTPPATVTVAHPRRLGSSLARYPRI